MAADVLGARGSVVLLTVGFVGNGALFHVRTSRVLLAEYQALGRETGGAGVYPLRLASIAFPWPSPTGLARLFRRLAAVRWGST